MTFADELRSSKGPQLTKEEIAGSPAVVDL